MNRICAKCIFLLLMFFDLDSISEDVDRRSAKYASHLS